MLQIIRPTAKLLLRICEHISAGVLAIISLVIPRDKRLWAFGSWYGRRFADNPKYFFLYCTSLEASPIRAVWLSKSRTVVKRLRSLGLPVHHRLSPRGLWYALRAGVYIVDCRVRDVSAVAGHGAIKVNVWHGIPLKMIERDIKQDHHMIAQAYRGAWPVRMLHKLLRPELSERYDYVLATSHSTAGRLASAFGVSLQQIVVAGYPRCDILISSDDGSRYLVDEERRLIDELRSHAMQGTRVLLYMPTFRDWQNVADRRIPIDWSALDHVLEVNGGVLYCKLHPNDQTQLPDLSRCSRVRLIHTSVDPYPILKHTDALITDYSSIYFDYLLLGKPVLFYPYDLEEYQRFSRTLYDRYEDVTPGPKASTTNELERTVAALLSRYAESREEWSADRERVRAHAHEFCNDGASERLLQMLIRELQLETVS